MGMLNLKLRVNVALVLKFLCYVKAAKDPLYTPGIDDAI